MSDMDMAIYTLTFNDLDYKVTRYTDKPDYVGTQVDRNWHDLGVNGPPIVVPTAETQYFDIEPHHARVDPSQSSAIPYEGVAGMIQAQHRLHCLNMLRQGLWYNWEYYRRIQHPDWSSKQEVMLGNYSLMELHTAHCVDQLRQSIMCESDLAIIPYMRDENGEGKMDFSRRKRCRNYDSLLHWHRNHSIGAELEKANGSVPYYSWTGRE
ncbi:hypothetical protein CBER1_11819 [Cercospora berteroae]|uniref:Uncharacterized protein n=2 Tax=Cercospora TaxID=29002 RepID=A0A2S6CLD9_9PEZI|nr:hypothetical protein CBER1_11819 [Cercospora berteroae]WPA97797.1 hypothetical protein RHO25_002408 [Cercospora beticola]